MSLAFISRKHFNLSAHVSWLRFFSKSLAVLSATTEVGTSIPRSDCALATQCHMKIKEMKQLSLL